MLDAGTICRVSGGEVVAAIKYHVDLRNQRIQLLTCEALAKWSNHNLRVNLRQCSLSGERL